MYQDIDTMLNERNGGEIILFSKKIRFFIGSNKCIKYVSYQCQTLNFQFLYLVFFFFYFSQFIIQINPFHLRYKFYLILIIIALCIINSRKEIKLPKIVINF